MCHLIWTAFCLFHLLFGGFKISSDVCDASPFCFKTLGALDFFIYLVELVDGWYISEQL